MKTVASSPLPWITLLCGMALALGKAQKQEPAPESAPNRPLPGQGLVLGQRRSAETDRILLRSGDELRGTILDGQFDLRTAYAQLTFKSDQVAGMEFAGEEPCLQTVITEQHDRLSGFLLEPALRVQLTPETRLEVRKEKIAKVVFRLRGPEKPSRRPGDLVFLRNGDLLNANWLADSISLITSQAVVKVLPVALHSITFEPGTDPWVTIGLVNGESLRGRLATDKFEVSLVGQDATLQLYYDRINRIERRSATPDPAQGGSQAPSAPGEAASPPHAAEAMLLGREDLVWIPAGQFTLGSPPEETDRDLDEGPQTRVVLTDPFWMAKCEVTQAEYEAVTGENPSLYTGDPRRPVEKVSWPEAMEFCRKLTQLHSAAGKIPPGYAYRLPTEAEWEYACRAGTTTRFSYGQDTDYVELGDYAWFVDNSDSATHPVAAKKPNLWGLYDMHGNVWEWCLDSWAGAFPGGTVTNLHVSSQGWLRVARGGSWLYDAKLCRSANRDDYGIRNRCSDLGFRVVLAPAPRPEPAGP